jgi:hypothetical protein
VPGETTGSPYHWEDINTETWFPGWVLGARLTTLFCENNAVAKSKEVKTGCSNLTESSKEGYGSKSRCFANDDDDDDDDDIIVYNFSNLVILFLY